MDGKNNGTDKCRTHKGKKLMLGVCTLVFLGVLLTGCFALGYKGVGAPGPTVPVKKTETVKKEQPALPEKKETPVESLQKKQEEPKRVAPSRQRNSLWYRGKSMPYWWTKVTINCI